MAKLPPSVLARLAARQATNLEHPDANLLTAFAERKLSQHQRAAVSEHLAHCGDCREIAFLIAQASRPSQPANWRLVAAAAMFFAVALSTWFYFKPLPAVPKPLAPPGAAAGPKAPVELPHITPPEARPETKTTAARTHVRVRHSTEAAANRKSSPLLPVLPLKESNPTLALQQQDTTRPTFSLAAPQVQRDALSGTALLPSAPLKQRVKAFLSASGTNNQTLWSLEAASRDGVVAKSDDGGKTWRVFSVDNVTKFYALSATVSEIWLGGAGGKLFHSLDGGVHWMLVSVTYDGRTIQDDITSLETRGDAITLKTASGLRLASTDGGEHWEQIR